MSKSFSSEGANDMKQFVCVFVLASNQVSCIVERAEWTVTAFYVAIILSKNDIYNPPFYTTGI